MKKIIAICIACLMLTAISITAFAGDDPTGIDISSFDTVDISGNKVTGSILSEYDVTVVNYWATWCGPCVNELTHLQRIYEEYADRNVNVLGILCEDSTSTPSAALQLCKTKGVTYTTIRVGNDSALNRLIDNSGRYIPVSYVVSSEGVVLDYVVGGMSYNQFVNLISPHLSTEPTTPPATEPPTTESPIAEYTVRFYDWDQTLLSEQSIKKGESATPPANPTRNGYVFSSWDASYENITSDINIYAKYIELGDANGDGSVNTGDAVLVLRHCVGIVNLDDISQKASDTNGDGNINTGDAVLILRSAVA